MGWGNLLLDSARVLRGGEEWAESIRVWSPGTLNVTAAGTAGFYIGCYERATFDNLRRANPVRFPFLLGSARVSHFARYQILQPGEYVLVVRVTSWAQQGAEIRVRVELQP